MDPFTDHLFHVRWGMSISSSPVMYQLFSRSTDLTGEAL